MNSGGALAQHRHDRRHDVYCPVLPVAQPAARYASFGVLLVMVTAGGFVLGVMIA